MDDVPACLNYLIVAFATEGMVLIGLSGFVNDCHCDNYKTIWNIIKLETNKSGISDKINTLNGEGNLIKNCQEIINIFNNYFSSITKNIILTHTWSVRKVSDRIFLCEHLMDYNIARLHEPTLNLSAHA